ncbi:MAG: ubiquitin-conjugating enzyme E2 [Candidatus Bathyarchaeia archaeon]
MDYALIYKEKSILNHQFPTVSAIGDPPVAYEGLLRCEKGPVKRLAEKGKWPFVEYVKWNKFRMELPMEYPLKPPTVTWLTEIPHPNIVPGIPGAVCVSVLGEGWNPKLGLVTVVNSLSYLLTDPNPESVFDHPICLKAANVCRSYGFPRMAPGSGKEVVRFNIVPIPRPRPEGGREVALRFKIG